MRSEAERCRNLAAHIATPSTRELERMANEFDEQADRLESEQDDDQSL